VAHAYFAADLVAVRAGDLITVTGPEARHAVSVARLRVGEQLTLLDGEGGSVIAEASDVGTAEFTARALADATVAAEPSPRILLVQALAKGGRDEMALQASVELGIDGVIPWQAQRSVSTWRGDKVAKQRERWQTIAREASKQAVRARVPLVEVPVTTKQLAHLAGTLRLVVLDPIAEAPLSELEPDARDLALVVGPEGGIDEREFALLTEAGAERRRLGANVLRTSTAGPAALAALFTKLGRW
jgi:16S rRNA (uracil1498-N3)-methyltransferase